ncbi:hypothetical protein OIU79_021176 [Salix purpurea]|uniref:Uncharacterized protein n=1 Tax=Salix purpurea TaxID=77065 RepID=A0A9Q0WNI4_SALPP|nr:hypothetical protein OIU79_021176 [Salix purpurea]
MMRMKGESWLPVVVVFVLFELMGHNISSAAFTPPDNYLIACGSSQNVSFQAYHLTNLILSKKGGIGSAFIFTLFQTRARI